MVDQVLSLSEDSKLMLLAPVVRGRKDEHANIFFDFAGAGLYPGTH